MCNTTTFLYEQINRHLIKLIILITLFAALFLANANNIVMAQDDSVITVEVLDLPEFPPDTVAVGEQISFRIRYSCGAVTGGNCDNFQINVTLPDWFDMSTAILDAGAPYATFTAVSGTGVITLSLTDADPTIAAGSRLDPGESETATVTIRVRDDAYDFSENVPPAVDQESVTTTVTSDANSGTVPPPTTIGLESPDIQWSIEKVRVLPPTSVTPALDQPVVYQMCLDSDNNVDNYVLNDFSITDTIPAGAEVLSPAEGGAVSYSPTGTNTPTSVTWTFTGENISFRNGSICRNITLRYPSTTFNLASVIDNLADSTLTTISGETCVSPCTDNDNDTHGFDVEVAAPTTNKDIAQNPVGLFGIGRWELSLNTAFSNAPTDTLEFIDEMPVDNDGVDPGPATPDYLPLEIFQILTGEWNPVSIGSDIVQIRATIRTSETTTCRTAPGGAVWTTVAGSPFDGSSQVSIPVATPNNIRCIQTIFENDEATGGVSWVTGAPMNFQVNTDFQILFNIRDTGGEGADYIGETLQNCMYTTSSVDGGPNDATIDSDTNCADVDISGSVDNVSVNFRKTMPSNPEPDEAITISLFVDLTERASADLISPIIADAFPDNIFIDTGSDFWDITYIGDFTGDTILTEAQIRSGVGGSGFSVTPQTVDPDAGGPLGPELRDVVEFDLASLVVAPPSIGSKTIRIDIFAEIRPFTVTTDGPAPPYNNAGYFVENGPGDLICEQTASTGNDGTVNDDDDVFGIGATNICRINRTYEVPRTARFAGQKWLRNENDPTNIVLAPGLSGICEDATVVTDGQVTESNYTRTPCVHESDVGDIFTYRLTVQNTGNISLYDYHQYDILPYEGDTGVSLISQPRGSFWRPVMTSAGVTFSDSGRMTDAPLNTILTAGDFTIEYSDSRNPCRLEVGITTGCDTVTWSTNPAADFANGWASVETFRIILNSGISWEPGIHAEFLVTMEVPAVNLYDTFTFAPTAGVTNPSAGLDPTQNPEVGHVSWNNYAHNFYDDVGQDPNDLLAVAEPPRVGILIPEFGSIGNFVFFDLDNDRRYEPLDGDLPVGNVTVELYEDTNANNNFDPGTDQLVTITTTGNPQVTDTVGDLGYYLFDNLPEGNYFVHLPNTNFTGGGALVNYLSSTDTATVVDNFNNNLDHGVDNGNNPSSNGVTSPVINISYDNEPTNDEGAGNISSDAADGPFFRGNQNEENNSSDLTVDFGFYRPMSIGNRVWIDDGTDSGAPNGFNSAFFNDGIINGDEVGRANVTVQLFGDFDGDGSEDAVPLTDVTDSLGYYLFDGLGEGDYRVVIPASNFASGQALEGYGSSYDVDPPVDIDIDTHDHGIDVALPVALPVSSPTITLVLTDEPVSEAISSDAGDGPNGRGTNGELDENSDLTVDFGFVAVMSIGNRIWLDDGAVSGGFDYTQFDDGILNGIETGISGTQVNLYFSTNLTTPISSTVTNSQGYYLFDNLPPGTYVVEIPATEFAANQPLEGFISSTDSTITPPADGTADNNDHGIDAATPGTDPVRTPDIILSVAGENQVDDEAVTNTNGEIQPSPPPIADNNSDLTVDLGFIRPMSIGNRVWLDTDRTTAGATLGDGIRQTAEQALGMGGVLVELWTDNGSGGLGNFVASTTTTGAAGVTGTNNGYYLFDRQGTNQTDPNARRLGPGDYIVHIPSINFTSGQPLFNYVNSDGTNASGGDVKVDSILDGGDENGVNAVIGNPLTYPISAGVSSGTLTLAFDDEATTEEQDFDPAFAANYNGENVEDDNGNLTVDFGFYQGLAIGNRVWFDGDRDGVIDATDNPFSGNPGIAGVTVHLYDASDLNTIIATDITDAEGYYIFDQLTSGGLILPGNYVVGIDPTIPANTTVLADHISTITRVSGTGTDSPTDNDDNGIDRRDTPPPATAVIYSETINLSHFDETITELDTDKETGVLDGNGIQDVNSNLTVDFGFFVPMSIGNQVWLDTNNDALINNGEVGLNGVLVELFRDTGGGIDPLNDTPYRTTTTNTNGGITEGYYIFDDLPEGDYIVRLSPENFRTVADGGNASLVDGTGAPYSSSESGGALEATYLIDNQTDDNDNGEDSNFPQTDGIVSRIINLSYYQEPDGNPAADDTNLDLDGSAGASGEGTFGERDDNGEMTVDFGVYPPLMSIGNRIFKDYDNNRILDGADVGVDNVIVNLFRDTNQDGIPDSGITNPISTTTTTGGGYYLFDGLVAGSYLVQVDENNFRTIGTGGNGILHDYYSSQDKDASNVYERPVDGDLNDSQDNGIDTPFNLANNPNLQANGVLSPTIVLTPSGEWAAEPDRGTLGDGDPNIQASNSDLTVDFGFYQPMSIGNHVWFDTNEDGLFNGAEAPIVGVQVELYRETGLGDPNALDAQDTIVQVYDGSTYLNFDTTNANGFYLFDNLDAGQYWVHIPATEFATGRPLFNYTSTADNTPNPTIAPAPSSDRNDNGIVNGSEASLGITSELITLGIIDPVNSSGLYIPNNSEPTNEIHKSNTPASDPTTYDGPASIGRYGEIDNNSDITIDFGFTLADDSSMSIGNRVWFDNNHDGLIDAGDDNPAAPGNPGIDDVVVLLYRADTNGLPVGSPIARDITANGGYYLFDVLDSDAQGGSGSGLDDGGPISPGNYVVAIPNGNFNSGRALQNHIVTIPNVDNPAEGYPALEDDDNDNGTRNATYGVLSNLITLVLQNERDDEVDKDVSSPPDIGDGLDATGAPITENNSNLTIDFGFYRPMSIGNQVWVDTNNNGIYDTATETPVDDGVIMALYEDDGVTPVDDPANPGTPYQVTTDNGFYLFEGLPQGDYVVRVDLVNFLPGGLLEGYTGSNDSPNGYQDNTDDDLNDNGFDDDPLTNGGIPSGVITLAYTTEPTGEATSGNPADGPNGRGNNGETDRNSNLTVDFGVFPTTYFSIGNRVWIDMGASTNTNNGVHDTDENGVRNVIVNLYRDEAGGPDGIPDSTTPFATTTTNGNGIYRFDSLASGNYIVSIAPENFEAGGVLRGYSPSPAIDPTESATDHVSDQISNTMDPDYGYRSATYTLSRTPTPEPTGEVNALPPFGTENPGTDPSGTPIPDDQSNLTVDFGFVQTMTIGNLVWFDLNGNGRYNRASEVGIAGVTVQLYLDDGSGTFDSTLDTPIATDVTDGNGFYLFENLSPGDYFVHIPNDPNWTNVSGTTPLNGFQSTTPDAASSDTGDNNDNGLGTGDTNPLLGVTSEMLTLSFGDAPTGENTLSNNPDDGPEFRGSNNPTDENSDLTWDFGFIIGDPMSIGNIVWIDDGNNTGIAGNGERDGDEVGVDGVIVELYADSDDNGVPDTVTPIDTVTTDDGGYYLFDGLPPGRYVVVIAEENFDGGVLDGYLSTQDGTPDIDDNDNGINNATPSNGGIRSDTIELVVGDEPTADSEAVTGTGNNGETDENSNLTVDFGFIAAYDWGDAPDSYSTDNDILTTVTPTGFSDQVGPSHRIVANLYLGEFVDDETSGVPVLDGENNNPTSLGGDDTFGDGADEDGMDLPIFVAGTTVTVDITVVNNTGERATLIAWFDWNGDGVFDASEGTRTNVPNGTDGIVQIEVTVPPDAEDLTGGDTYARLRLTTDTMTRSDFNGPMDSGEVEDYYIEVLDPGLLLNKTDGLNSIVAGEVNTYTIVIQNSGDPRTGVTFYDEIPLATDTDANGYDPETVEWTCVAENGASCIANAASGTGSSGGPYSANATSVIIDELIDLPRDGIITYTVTARVNEDAGLIPPGNINPIVNLAQLPNEAPPLEDEDITNVIFDPPYGIKTGTYEGNNIIRWTMTWYNPGATQTNVTITDQLESNQVFPDTTSEIDLQCSGSTGTCSIVGDDVVQWIGTMLTSTPANDDEAIVISFNVLIDGDGRYTNTAVLDYGDDETAATDRVTVQEDVEVIDDDDDDDDDENVISGDDGGYSQSAPTLAKTVDTPFTLPGATVTWTITAVNDTNESVNNVSITDNVPSQLLIIDGSSSSGELTIDGQTVTVKQDSLEPGEIITITLTTDISDSVAIPFAINNPAVLRCDCSNESNAIATIISVLELPATGETPWWRMPLMLMIIIGGGISIVTPMTVIYRRKSKHNS